MEKRKRKGKTFVDVFGLDYNSKSNKITQKDKTELLFTYFMFITLSLVRCGALHWHPVQPPIPVWLFNKRLSAYDSIFNTPRHPFFLPGKLPFWPMNFIGNLIYKISNILVYILVFYMSKYKWFMENIKVANDENNFFLYSTSNKTCTILWNKYI